MQIAGLRVLLGLVATGELFWSLAFYFRPDLALGTLGRTVIDPVIARQYPVYLVAVALAYALATSDPRRYRGIVWICVAQRGVESVVALIDWRARAISTPSLAWILGLELATALGLVLCSRRSRSSDVFAPASAGDRGLVRLLRGFGCLELFWCFASTIFVQFGARLLHYKLQDPYTTQQQGIALLIIGLTSLLAADDVSRYRIFVWVPVASQLIGVANAFNEIRLGSITWGIAAIQWTIQLAIVGAFFYYSRRRDAVLKPAPSLNAR
jgi:hypothetical protein